MQQAHTSDMAAVPSEVYDAHFGQNEIDLVEYLREIWRARFLLVLSGLLFSALGFGVAYLLPKKYDATLVAVPVLGEGSGRLGELGALASQFGGLASLAGISLPGKSRNEEALAVLESQKLTRQFISENRLLPVLYPKLWDPSKMRWRAGHPPGLWRANRDFKNIRHVSEDRETGLVTLTVRWKNPVQAAAWANDLVALTNQYLRNEAIQQAQRSIDYLNEQASKTDEVELKAAIYSLLQDEIEKEMLARGRDQYALKVVDPAYVPEKAAWPRPILLTGIFGLFGAFVALTYIYVRKVFVAEKSD